MIKNIQIGTSIAADFQESSWTFEMPKDFEMSAGVFAIVPIENKSELNNGALSIVKERAEQITKHGRTIQKDVEFNTSRQLSNAASILASYDAKKAANNKRPHGWGIDIWDKMVNKPYKERLKIAGALLAAEIDRLTLDEFLKSQA